MDIRIKVLYMVSCPLQVMLSKAWNMKTTSSCSKPSPTYRLVLLREYLCVIPSVGFSSNMQSLCFFRRILIFSLPPPTMKIQTSENRSRSITSQPMRTPVAVAHWRERPRPLPLWRTIPMAKPRLSQQRLVYVVSEDSCSALNRSSGLTWPCELSGWARWTKRSRFWGQHVWMLWHEEIHGWLMYRAPPPSHPMPSFFSSVDIV